MLALDLESGRRFRERPRYRTRMAGALALVAGLLLAPTMWARSIIKEPGNHPYYYLELEPHGSVGPLDPPGDSRGSGLGLGLRLTIPVAPDGFISSINDSVGIGFGADWLRYHDEAVVGFCTERGLIAPDGTPICTEVAHGGGRASYWYFPVVMQWNFWLLRELSVFGEPGLAFYYQTQEHDPDHDFGLTPALHVGGRWHFSKWGALTLRVGYPTVSLGFSFFL